MNKSTLIVKLKKDIDLEELDTKELKRIKTLKKRRKLQHSFLFAGNLKQWEENIKHKDYCDIRPGAQYWFKTPLQDFDQRDRRAINLFIKSHVKPESEMLQLGISKSRSILGGGPFGNGKNIIHGGRGDNLKISLNNMLNNLTDEIEMFGNNSSMYNGEQTAQTAQTKQSIRRQTKKNNNAGNMDLLKKFRYNFNYWLKNCYQPQMNIEDHNKEIYQTTNASNAVADQIYQMAKNKSFSTDHNCGKQGSIFHEPRKSKHNFSQNQSIDQSSSLQPQQSRDHGYHHGDEAAKPQFQNQHSRLLSQNMRPYESSQLRNGKLYEPS